MKSIGDKNHTFIVTSPARRTAESLTSPRRVRRRGRSRATCRSRDPQTADAIASTALATTGEGIDLRRR